MIDEWMNEWIPACKFHPNRDRNGWQRDVLLRRELLDQQPIQNASEVTCKTSWSPLIATPISLRKFPFSFVIRVFAFNNNTGVCVNTSLNFILFFFVKSQFYPLEINKSFFFNWKNKRVKYIIFLLIKYTKFHFKSLHIS
jgi:hypothetical protein